MVEPPTRNPDPLQPVLEDAEAELGRRLREACEAEERGVSTESTHEIRQLEDALLAAAVAARQTIALRLHMRGGRSPEGARRRPIETSARADRKDVAGQREPAPDVAQETNAESAPSTVVREFTDSLGRAWRAWPVTPRAAAGAGERRFLGSFQEGWICFEALDSSARRRLPRQPPRWAELGDEELGRLLQEAITAPVRTTKPT